MTPPAPAADFYVGTTKAKAVYVGTEQAWSAQFDPNSITGLRLWLTAEDYTPGSWQNRVQAGPVMTFKGNPPPTVSANTKNGLPLVRFRTNEGRLRCSTTGIDLNYTLAYVARMVPGGNSVGRVLDAIYTPANLLIGYWNGFEDVFYFEGFLTPDTRKSVTSNWHLYSADAQGLIPVTFDDYKPRVFSNGVFLAGDNKMTGGWKGTFAINGYALDSAEETCDCEIAEVLLYNRRLPDPDRQAVETYLREKWGLLS